MRPGRQPSRWSASCNRATVGVLRLPVRELVPADRLAPRARAWRIAGFLPPELGEFALGVPPAIFATSDLPSDRLKFMPKSRILANTRQPALMSTACASGFEGTEPAAPPRPAGDGNSGLQFGTAVDDCKEVPAAPPANVAQNMDRDDTLYRESPCYAQRPVWTRQALKASLPPLLVPSEERLKGVLPQLAYNFTNGPWRSCWSRTHSIRAARTTRGCTRSSIFGCQQNSTCSSPRSLKRQVGRTPLPPRPLLPTPPPPYHLRHHHLHHLHHHRRHHHTHTIAEHARTTAREHASVAPQVGAPTDLAQPRARRRRRRRRCNVDVNRLVLATPPPLSRPSRHGWRRPREVLWLYATIAPCAAALRLSAGGRATKPARPGARARAHAPRRRCHSCAISKQRNCSSLCMTSTRTPTAATAANGSGCESGGGHGGTRCWGTAP